MNPIPNTITGLFSLTRACLNGAKKHGAAIPLETNTHQRILDDFQAASEACNLYDGAVVLKSDTILLRVKLENDTHVFLKDLRHHLEKQPGFGPRWNVRWKQAGWKKSLALPRMVEDRLECLRTAAAFLGSSPALEKASDQLTSQRATELEQPLDTANNNVNNCDSDITKKLQAREEALEALRRRLRGLIGELEQKLDALDAKWAAFGLTAPGETQRPEQVTGVTVDTTSVPGGAGDQME